LKGANLFSEMAFVDDLKVERRGVTPSKNLIRAEACSAVMFERLRGTLPRRRPPSR